MELAETDAARKPAVSEVARWVNNLRAEGLHHRVEAVSRVRDIAQAFGPARTRQEVVPFLTETTDDEDEYCLAMAQQLGVMVQAVGGPDHAPCLLPALELLACAEERVVREAAVTSIMTICTALAPSSVDPAMLPLCRGLANNQWHTGRMSACALLPVLYPRLKGTAGREEALGWAMNLVADEIPTVRKALTLNVGALCPHLDAGQVEGHMLPLLEKLCQDDQDSVRSQLLVAVAPVARATPPLQHGGRLLQLTLAAAADESWRVRWSFGARLLELCEVFSPQPSQAAFCAAYASLLCDVEPEVRVGACDDLTAKCAAFTPELLAEHIVPACQRLVADEIDYVRRSAAKHVTGLAPRLGQAAAMDQVLPLTLSLLRDADPEVRLNVVSSLRPLHETVGLDSLKQTLLPAIRNLAEAPHWRTRIEIVKLGPTLADQLGEAFFNEHLVSTVLAWLSDEVFAVREAAAVNLPRFLIMFGASWGSQRLLPMLVDMCGATSYVPRYTACLAARLCAEIPEAASLAQDLLPQLFTLVNDPVANVRINAAEGLAALGRGRDTLGADLLQRILQSLDGLSRDADGDVQITAQAAKRYIREGGVPPSRLGFKLVLEGDS